MGAAIHVHKLNAWFGSKQALFDITLEVPGQQTTAIIGPSGCGKSTLLNAIAGFSLPSSGAITTDGKPVTSPGPDRGMVFQEYALFPWMTVEQNVAFGLEIKGMAKVDIQQRVLQLLGKLGLVDFKSRFPGPLDTFIVRDHPACYRAGSDSADRGSKR